MLTCPAAACADAAVWIAVPQGMTPPGCVVLLLQQPRLPKADQTSAHISHAFRIGCAIIMASAPMLQCVSQSHWMHAWQWHCFATTSQLHRRHPTCSTMHCSCFAALASASFCAASTCCLAAADAAALPLLWPASAASASLCLSTARTACRASTGTCVDKAQHTPSMVVPAQEEGRGCLHSRSCWGGCKMCACLLKPV